jgi:hypothetical protein
MLILAGREKQVGKLDHDGGNTKSDTGLLGRDLVFLQDIRVTNECN